MASSVYPHEMTRDVSWTGYLEFLDSPEYHRPRYTYDGRDLEIYTTTLGEGSSTSILDGLVARLCVELGLGFWTSRSTFYSCSRTKGLRPDICFWFGTERLVRGQKFTSPEDVPRPELAIEVHREGSALDRLGVYAVLGFPEVWFYRDDRLEVLHLGKKEQYLSSRSSRCLPMIDPSELSKWVRRSFQDGHLDMVRAFDAWVREAILPSWQQPE